jgi:PAS domain S-box-containing protein
VTTPDDEDDRLRSVTLQNATSILLARQRAEEELVRTKEALRESQERLTAALSAAGTGTFRWDIETNTVEWDGNLDRLFGLEPGQTVQSLETFIRALHPDDRDAVGTRIAKSARDGSDFDMEFRVVWPDGSVHWIHDKAKAVLDPAGRPSYMTGACADVTSRLAAAEAHRANEERLSAMFNQAAVGIANVGLDGTFIDTNRKFAQIVGYAPEELPGRTFMELTHVDDMGGTQEAVAKLMDGGLADYSLEERYIRKDGSVVWSLTTVTLLKDAAGAPERFLTIIEDITARRKAEDALREESRTLELIATDNARLYQAAQKAAEERKALLESERAARTAAERMSSVKDEFLATLSHELRTPLNAILGWSQVLRSGAHDPADVRKGLETIERNARIQTQLIEDLLDMSRITSGKLRLDIQTILPASVIEAALETVKPSADGKGIRLERFVDPSAGPISGDPGRIQQVVWNLLSNAIKFTPREGKVQVRLERVNSHVELTVSDTGIGIKPELLPHLFERFRQGDPSTTRHYGGLGLGLSIVENLVALHGGTVTIKSPGDGLGTTVTVQLPLSVVHRRESDARLHPGPSLDTAPSFVSAELQGLSVLVVDDQVDARELIRRILEDCGATVVTADSGEQALRLITAQKPDVLVSDIGMPHMDGFELLRRVRELGMERGGMVPAIALTAFARSEDRTRALRAGFLVHVSKPVAPAELVATVASVARRVDHHA